VLHFEALDKLNLIIVLLDDKNINIINDIGYRFYCYL